MVIEKVLCRIGWYTIIERSYEDDYKILLIYNELDGLNTYLSNNIVEVVMWATLQLYALASEFDVEIECVYHGKAERCTTYYC